MNENDGNMEYIQLKQLPKSTLNDAGRQFLNYSTAIFALSTQNSADDAKLIGSGTFVTVNQRNYVLTASHVIKSRPFERAEGIGFALKTGRHHFSLKREHLTDIHFGAATDPQSGPDLALISIPEAHVGTISAYNSFWNINGNSTTALNEPIELIHSAWVLVGCPDEETLIAGPSGGFMRNMSFMNMVGFGGAENYRRDYDFDYINFIASYDEESSSPASFGGVSGGGLWWVRFLINPDKSITLDNYFLYGVAFYQMPIEKNERRIICHARQSIYSLPTRGELH